MKKIEFRQNNMYCNVCFINAVTALAGIDGVRELDVDKASKTIRLQMDNAAMGRKKIQELVNRAITGGRPPTLAHAN
jgi:copper chaperone CopZ